MRVQVFDTTTSEISELKYSKGYLIFANMWHSFPTFIPENRIVLRQVGDVIEFFADDTFITKCRIGTFTMVKV